MPRGTPSSMAPGIVYDVSLTLHSPTAQMKGRIPILTVGPDTIWMWTVGPNEVRFGLDDPRGTTTGPPADLVPNFVYPFELDVDPYLRWLTFATFGSTYISAEWPHGVGAPVSAVQPRTGGYPYSVAVSEPVQDVSLCRSLLNESGGSPTVGSASGPPQGAHSSCGMMPSQGYDRLRAMSMRSGSAGPGRCGRARDTSGNVGSVSASGND